jgi:hypothetical protein
MSALLPKADIHRHERHVRFVPKADIRPASFDHLVGSGDQRLRNGQTERFGRLEIDRQLELVGRLHWKIEVLHLAHFR